MCVVFICTGCDGQIFNFCNDTTPSDSNSSIGKPQTCPPDLCTPHPNAPRQKCLSCEAVIGAVEQLTRLLYLYPWLATEGLSKLDDMADWEKDAGMLEGLTRKTKKWDQEDESREEERKFEIRFKEMGLHGLEDERKVHQGFGSRSPTLVEGGTVFRLSPKEESAFGDMERENETSLIH